MVSSTSFHLSYTHSFPLTSRLIFPSKSHLSPLSRIFKAFVFILFFPMKAAPNKMRRHYVDWHSMPRQSRTLSFEMKTNIELQIAAGTMKSSHVEKCSQRSMETQMWSPDLWSVLCNSAPKCEHEEESQNFDFTTANSKVNFEVNQRRFLFSFARAMHHYCLAECN